MRVLLFALAIVGGLSALGAASPAKAWHDQWGRWHPNHGYPVYYHHHYWHHRYWHHHYW